jgi:hypothetical protein
MERLTRVQKGASYETQFWGDGPPVRGDERPPKQREGSTAAGICEPKANNNRSWTALPSRQIRARPAALLLEQVTHKEATPFQVGTWQNARNAAPSRPR